MKTSSRCPNCGHQSALLPFGRVPNVVRCGLCGGWQYTGDVQPADELYSESYFTGGEYAAYERAARSHALNFERKVRLLVRHLGFDLSQARLLEVGCATGEFLRVASQHGVADRLGIEPSEWCRNRCSKRGHRVLDPNDPDLSRSLGSLRANLIAAWDVWEHLSDPAHTFDSLIAQADNRLAIAITTVDAASWVARVRSTRWRQFHPPTHLSYPTKRSLKLYLEARNFRVVYHGYFGYYRPLFEYSRAVLGSRFLGRESPLAWFPVYLNLFDTQIVIAQRGA